MRAGYFHEVVIMRNSETQVPLNFPQSLDYEITGLIKCY